MKYCQHCGAELHEEAVVCIHCGCAVQKEQVKKRDDGLLVAARIFMIISCALFPFIGIPYGIIMLATAEMAWVGLIFLFFFCLPLAWCIPLTVTVSKRIKDNEPVGTGYKIAVLLTVNTIAGILLLCSNDD